MERGEKVGQRTLVIRSSLTTREFAAAARLKECAHAPLGIDCAASYPGHPAQWSAYIHVARYILHLRGRGLIPTLTKVLDKARIVGIEELDPVTDGTGSERGAVGRVNGR